MTYKAGDSVNFQQVFVGKATNALDGYFGCVILDKPVGSNVTAILSSGFTNYGTWYSDGASHTIDASEAITEAAKKENTLWFKIPATNITSAASIAWIRLEGTIRFS